MGWLIIVGSIPIVVLGLLFQDQIETTLRDLRIVAIALVVLLADPLLGRPRGREEAASSTTSPSAHGIALRPRPGAGADPGRLPLRRHDHAGLFLGYTREAAARYSFLLAIPAVLGLGASTRPTRRSRATSPARRSTGGRRSWPRSSPSASGSRVIAWLLRYLDPRQLHAVRRLPHRARPAGPRRWSAPGVLHPTWARHPRLRAP